MTVEGDLVKAVLQYLGYKHIFAWRNNSGAFKDSGGSFYRFGKKGSSDILGVTRDGKFLAIECKVGRGKPTPEQVDFLKQVRENGGIAILAYSLNDVMLVL